MTKLILTDIDDTILLFADTFQKWAVEEKGFTLTQSIRDGGSIQDAIGCHRDHVDELVVEFSNDPHWFSTIPPEPDAKDVLPILYDMGYQFVAISSCVDGPTVTARRRKNLEEAFGIPWLEVHCTGLLQPKRAYLEVFEPTWWVEDNSTHAMVGAELGHTTFLLDRAYNRDIEASMNPKRIKNWYDVLETIIESERNA